MNTQDQPQTELKRPAWVTGIAILHIILAIVLIAVGAFVLVLSAHAAQSAAINSSVGGILGLLGNSFAILLWIAGTVAIMIGLMSLLVVYGLLKRLKWAWWASIIVILLFGIESIVGLIGSAVVIYNLVKRPDVREWFNTTTGSYKVPAVWTVVVVIIGIVILNSTNPVHITQYYANIYPTYNTSTITQAQQYNIWYNGTSTSDKKGILEQGDGCSTYSTTNMNITCQKAFFLDNDTVSLNLSQSWGHSIPIYDTLCYSNFGSWPSSSTLNETVNNKSDSVYSYNGIEVNSTFTVTTNCNSTRTNPPLNAFILLYFCSPPNATNDQCVPALGGQWNTSVIYIQSNAVAT